jgi:hypothetical protein
LGMSVTLISFIGQGYGTRFDLSTGCDDLVSY